MVFEPIEILEVSAIAEVKKMVEDCMQPLPMPDFGLNLPLKEESEKFEAKQIKDAIDNHLSPKTKKELRTKRTATRTDFMTRKKLAAESPKAACHLPPLAPKKNNGKKTSDKMQPPQEVKGSNEIKQNSKSPQSNENKKDEASATSSTAARINVYTKKLRKISTEMEKLVEVSLPTDKGISGEGGSNLPIMRTIEEIKKSKGYRDAPDAPSFSLGFDDVTQKSPIKSTTDDFITSSMFDQLCDDAMKNSAKHQDYSTINTNPTINTNHLSPEQETIYNEICKWRSRSGADTSPDAFKSNEITATASELANSMTMGRSLNTIALQVGTFVLSKDPAQRRKKIMSPWVGLKMMMPTEAYYRMVEKAFDFLITEYDLNPDLVPNP